MLFQQSARCNEKPHKPISITGLQSKNRHQDTPGYKLYRRTNEGSHRCPAVNIRTRIQNCNHFRKFVALVFFYYLLRRPPDPTLCAQYANGSLSETRWSWCNYTSTHTISTTQSQGKHEIHFLIRVSSNPWLTNKRNKRRSGNKAMKIETEQEN